MQTSGRESVVGDPGFYGAVCRGTHTTYAAGLVLVPGGEVKKSPPGLRAAGLFAGIGGIELGLEQAGHHAALLCENDPACRAVLNQRFGVRLFGDITKLSSLPEGVDLVAAGFPCQDLSQAGSTTGISGERSGLVMEVFRLLKQRRVPWVLLENVPFMLQLSKGRAMSLIVSEMERLGYRWAYRVVDSRSFGLPQRRRRVYFLASLDSDPASILFADECGPPVVTKDHRDVACGFYWTEGLRGLGWAVNCVPTLKGGSSVGIPSPPAIVLPSGEICKPDIRDAERLQGFSPDWTKQAETAGRPSGRWKLVGNAVSVPSAEWIGRRLTNPGERRDTPVGPLEGEGTWPLAAFGQGGKRYRTEISEWPERIDQPNLVDFLQHPTVPLSARATAGFLSRTERSSLRFPEGFINQIRAHLERSLDAGPSLRLLEPPGQYATA